MNADTYEDVLLEAEKLPVDQCRKLIERLVQHVRSVVAGPHEPPAWEDYARSAPYPLCDGDAQECISRARIQSDAARQTVGAG